VTPHPYTDLPASSHWRRAFDHVAPEQVDPVGRFKFAIRHTDKIATAGSCFAQHIARHLARSGFNHHVVEPGHAIGSAATKERFGYGLFSARYGNIYTSRQLVQLIDRAFGHFVPVDDCWSNAAGRPIDPFRPTIQPDGFASREELFADRRQHLRAVRRLFETLDYFVFTLGLTETWVAASDGAVFPVCPGVAGNGRFDAQAHRFVNLTFADVVADLEAFRTRLLAVNAKARIILTVSPVPLMATMEPRHVLVSTTASKAILRAAVDQVERRFDDVAYYPSYELINGSFSRGEYFGQDLRSITEKGVEHVMRLFLQRATESGLIEAPSPANGLSADSADGFMKSAETIVRTICDEDLL
jgi:hypothetical protein